MPKSDLRDQRPAEESLKQLRLERQTQSERYTRVLDAVLKLELTSLRSIHVSLCPICLFCGILVPSPEYPQ